MKLPDLLAQYRRRDRAPDPENEKAYEPIQPGSGKKSYRPIRPKSGTARGWPFLLAFIALSVVLALHEFVGNSEPFRISSSFIKENPSIREDLGRVSEIRPWFPVSIKATGNVIQVRLTLRIKGQNGAGKAFMTLVHVNDWRIAGAIYENRQGRRIDLTPGKERGEASRPASDTGEGGLAAGHSFFRQGDFPRALAAYDRVLAADPTNSTAYYWRGRTYDKMNLPDKAAADFSKTVILNPNHVEAHNWLGWLAEQEKRYDECVAHLTRAVALRADNAWGYYHRGRCYYQQGKKMEARQDAERSCRLGYDQACKTLKQLP